MNIVPFFFLLIYGKLIEVFYHLKSAKLIGIYDTNIYSENPQYLFLQFAKTHSPNISGDARKPFILERGNFAKSGTHRSRS